MPDLLQTSGFVARVKARKIPALEFMEDPFSPAKFIFLDTKIR
jgi:hypothetical protein